MAEIIHHSNVFTWAFHVSEYDGAPLLLLGSFSSVASVSLKRSGDLLLFERFTLPARTRSVALLSSHFLQSESGRHSIANILIATENGKCYLLQLVKTPEKAFPTIRIRDEFVLDTRMYNHEQLGKSIDLCPNASLWATNSFAGDIVFFFSHHPSLSKQVFAQLSIDGIILHTIFVPPKRSSSSCVTYVCLFLDSNSNPRINVYRWSKTETFSDASSYITFSIPVPSEFSLASHIIPCSNIPDHFLVLLETKICLLSVPQIECGDLKFLQTDLPCSGSHNYPLSIANDNETPNCCYLTYENGDLYRIRYSILSIDINLIGKTGSSLGNLILPCYPYIVFCGDCSDTLVYDVSVSPMSFFGSLIACAPMWDFVYSSSRHNTLLDEDINCNTVYATAGIGKSGCLVTMRYGCSSTTLLEAILTEGAVLSGIINSNHNSEFYAWLTYPWQTQILRLHLDGVVEDVTESLFLDDIKALYVINYQNTFIIITGKSIYAVTPSCTKYNLLEVSGDEEFVLAAYNELIFIVKKDLMNFKSQLLTLKLNTLSNGTLELQSLPDSFDLHDVPTCITSFSLERKLLVILVHPSPYFECVFYDETSHSSVYKVPLTGFQFGYLPHSISYLRKSNRAVYVLISSNSTLLTVYVTLTLEGVPDFKVYSNPISTDLPLTLQSPSDEFSTIYAWSDYLYIVGIDMETEQPTLNQILEVNDSFTCVSGIYDIPNKFQNSESRIIVYYSNNTLYLSELWLPQRTFSSKLNLAATPKRLLVDKYTNTLIIGCCHVLVNEITTSGLAFYDLTK